MLLDQFIAWDLWSCSNVSRILVAGELESVWIGIWALDSAISIQLPVIGLISCLASHLISKGNVGCIELTCFRPFSSYPSDLHAAVRPLVTGHTVIPYTSSRTDVWDAMRVLDVDPDNSNNGRETESIFLLPWCIVATTPASLVAIRSLLRCSVLSLELPTNVSGKQ